MFATVLSEQARLKNRVQNAVEGAIHFNDYDSFSGYTLHPDAKGHVTITDQAGHVFGPFDADQARAFLNHALNIAY